MRFVLILVVLILAACEGSFVRPKNLGKQVQIRKSYAFRDACLVGQAAAEGTDSIDSATLAHAAAAACSQETEALVTASNFDGNATVASNIRQDSEFRAMKFVMQARGQAIF